MPHLFVVPFYKLVRKTKIKLKRGQGWPIKKSETILHSNDHAYFRERKEWTTKVDGVNVNFRFQFFVVNQYLWQGQRISQSAAKAITNYLITEVIQGTKKRQFQLQTSIFLICA